MSDLTMWGETFQLEDTPNEFALMEFAEHADAIDEDNSLAAMAAIYRLIQSAVVAKDWPRFRTAARKNRATVEILLPIAVDLYQEATERPTVQPSGSSDGLPDTAQKSEGGSSSDVERLLSGRPDLQVVAKMAQEARSA